MSQQEQVLDFIEQLNEKPGVEEYFLEHYGTRGMKWGVRKARSSKPTSSDFKKTAKYRRKKPSQLSNKQLKEVNARINLEQNYSRLNPSRVTVGRDTVKGIIAAAGTAATLYNLANSPAGQAAIRNGKRILNK